MKSDEIWGPGPFDNIIAQTFAFNLKSEFTNKTLPGLLRRFDTAPREPAEALEVIALAEFWNLVAGHSPHATNCPLLTDWVLSQKLNPLDDGALAGVPAILRNIAADPKTSKLFRKAAADWRSEVEKTAIAIEAGKKPRPVKPVAIALKTLKTVVAGGHGWGPGLLYPMERGSDDVHINLYRAHTPQEAIAMSRYPTVVSLSLNFSNKKEEAALQIPFRILLQRWCDRLTRLDCDVGPKTWNSKFLDDALPELEHLSKIEVFKSVRFDVSDEVVAALARSPTLREIRISCEKDGPTSKIFDVLNGKKSMKILWLRGARISTKDAAAFAKANPKINVNLNTYGR